VFGLVFGLVGGLVGGLVFGFVFGLVFGLAFGFSGSGNIDHEPGYINMKIKGRISPLIHKLKAGLTVGLTIGLVGGLTIGLVGGLTIGLTIGLKVGLTIGLVGGLVLGLAVGLLSWASGPIRDDHSANPSNTLRRDLQLLSLNGLMAGLTVGLAAGLAAGLVFGLAVGLTVGLAAGVTGGPAVGFVSSLAAGPPRAAEERRGNASARYLVSISILAWQRHTPPRLMRFLQDAHRLGLLREAGPVYQFRHARLQDHLATAHPQCRSTTRAKYAK
jgi:hypothetical protein